MLEGKTEIGAQVALKPNCRIVDSFIDDGAAVESSLITSARIGKKTTVGPNAYIRPTA
jgi:bifunctional UDP-N-acetylglucosamine pyrophosphorylase/glucosamine-1-phosphate N-acetyltransferase